MSFPTVLAPSTNPRMSVPHVEHVERKLSSEESCVELRIKVNGNGSFRSPKYSGSIARKVLEFNIAPCFSHEADL